MQDTQKKVRNSLKYLHRDKKVEYSGSTKQLIEYVKEKYSNSFWVKENFKLLDNDSGIFKMTVECLGMEFSDKMTDKEFNKTHKKYVNSSA